MALPILDGNQTAATLSTVLTSGEHIPAHTVVSLGSQAITDVRSAVSGSVVSISNFPASQSTTFGAVTGSVSVLNFPSTQTIAGTVTANVNRAINNENNFISIAGESSGDAGIMVGFRNSEGNTNIVGVTEESGAGPLPISGTVTVGNSVTIASLPAISGTVTANCIGQKNHEESTWGGKVVPVQIIRADTDIAGTSGAPLIVAFDTNSGSTTVTVGNSVTIGSVPNGSLTTRFGTPTTANVSFATSAVTNANRKYLLIQNVTTGSNVITVGIGFTPTTTQGIQLTAGAGITFESSYIPTGAVYVLSSVTASNFTILEA